MRAGERVKKYERKSPPPAAPASIRSRPPTVSRGGLLLHNLLGTGTEKHTYDSYRN